MLRKVRNLLLVALLIAPHLVLFKNTFMSMESAYGRSQAIKSEVQFESMPNEMGQKGTGTGMIYKSTSKKSWILTNAHVCEMMQEMHGGYANTHMGKHKVQRIQISQMHDICMAEVGVNLKLNNKLSYNRPAKGDRVWIVGHPSGLPLIIEEGYVSERKDIPVGSGKAKCEPEDYQNPERSFECAFTNHYTLVDIYDSLLVNGMVEPGSSGSPVYNEYGNVVALVFATSGRRGRAWCVPWEYLNMFMTKELAQDKFVEL